MGQDRCKKSRRWVLGAAAAGLVGFAGYKFWPNGPEFDYFFLGETHGLTPLETIVSEVEKSNVNRVALEGYKQGIIDSNEIQRVSTSIKKEEKLIDNFVQDFNKVCMSIQEVEKAFNVLEANGVVASNASFFGKSLYWKARGALINIYSANFDLSKPGTRLLEPLQQKGLTLVGMENEEQFNQGLEIGKISYGYGFEKDMRFYDKVLGVIEVSGNDKQIKNSYDILVGAKDLIVEYARDKGFVDIGKLTQENKKENEELFYDYCVLERSRTWMKYLMDKKETFVVCGSAHLIALKILAKDLQSSFKVVYEDSADDYGDRFWGIKER